MAKPTEPSVMKIEVRPLAKIKPFWNNPRKIGDKTVRKVASSLRRYGWQQTIVVDRDGVIVVGHARHEAACAIADAGHKIKGWPDPSTAPVVVFTGTEAEAKAYRLDDNRAGEEAQWDRPKLAEEIAGLAKLKFDVGKLAFDPDEIAALVRPKEPPEPVLRGHTEYRCPQCEFEWSGSPKPDEED